MDALQGFENSQVQQTIYSQTVKFVSLPEDDDNMAHAYIDTDCFGRILEGLQDMPVMIVTISGEYRTGKTFLLNLMATYLEHMTNVRAAFLQPIAFKFIILRMCGGICVCYFNRMKSERRACLSFTEKLDDFKSLDKKLLNSVKKVSPN